METAWGTPEGSSPGTGRAKRRADPGAQGAGIPRLRAPPRERSCGDLPAQRRGRPGTLVVARAPGPEDRATSFPTWQPGAPRVVARVEIARHATQMSQGCISRRDRRPGSLAHAVHRALFR